MLILSLLMLVLPLNTSWAAIAGVCDKLDGHEQLCSWWGHHGDDHERHHDHAQNTMQETLQVQQLAAANENSASCDHGHAHPLFSVILPALPKLHFYAEIELVLSLPAATFVSAVPARLERPPRLAYSSEIV